MLVLTFGVVGVLKSTDILTGIVFLKKNAFMDNVNIVILKILISLYIILRVFFAIINLGTVIDIDIKNKIDFLVRRGMLINHSTTLI